MLKSFGGLQLLLLLLLGVIWPVDSFVNAPKIISKDGNLIFESGANRNISFRLTGSSRLIINEDYDLLELLMPIGGSKKRPSGAAKDEWSPSEDIVDLREMADQLIEFRSQALGPNGLTAMLRNLQNSTRASRLLLRRLHVRLHTVENMVQRLKSKLQLDSCRSNPCENGGNCLNTYDGYRCQCLAAFEGSKCERDVNECALYEGTDLGCQNGGQCVNQLGSFTCICTPGWHGLHCSQRKTDCAAASAWELCGHGSCVPSSDALGYRCLCEAGWRSNGLTPTCTEDVDECSVAAHTPCSTRCINLPGSFTCAPCAPGLTGNGVSCRDINECETNNGGCSLSPRVECINSFGSSHCGECPVGWLGDGRTCQRNTNLAPNGSPSAVGLTSCAQRASICHPAAICSEISSTIVCSCPSGMVGSGYGENGCVRGTNNNCNNLPCLNGGVCIDEGTSNYKCICQRGFHGPRCDPLPNPCTSQPCKNNGRCIPTPSGNGGGGFVCQCQPGYRGRLCDVRFSSCNAMLTGPTGRLRFPPTGDVYDHNAQCAWVIRTNASLVLNVTIHSFHVEDSTECRFDWLQVNDGRSAADQIIGRYCGNHIPHGGNIISSSNQLYLWFRSDNTTAHAGFDLTWESILPQCGGLVEFETYGTLSSPGSPGNYPRNRDCVWRLLAPSSKRIMLTFFSLQLEQHETCNFDFVSITDAISGRELYKYCRREQPAPLMLPTHDAIVRFHSDDTGSDLGFQLHYSAEQRLPGCGGVYTSKEGSIRSPPRAVEDAAVSCDYEIQMALGETISMDFASFQMPSDACVELYDVLNSTNESSTSTVSYVLQSKYCGGNDVLPPSLHSLYNRVRVRFYAGTTAAQFELRYHMDCSYTFNAPNDTVSSPGYPQLAKVDRTCTYKILTAPNTVIVLKRMDFFLNNFYISSSDSSDTEEVGGKCSHSGLRINDGLNQAVLGPYCGEQAPPEEYASQTNMLTLHLETDRSTYGDGFRFEYYSLPVASTHCGGIYTKEGDNIRLPVDASGKYANDITCYWIIMAPPGKAIQLHWVSFQVEGTIDCNYDFVEVYDDLVEHADDTMKPLARFCDNQVPEDMLSHARILTIKFVSDSSDSDAGFELAYRFVERNSCGGHIHSTTGMLNSPGYPLNYSSNVDCVWQLSAPTGYQMELQVDLFELVGSPNCTDDWLEVRNGGSNSSILIGRFCGTSIPRRIPSFTHDLYVRFHTDDVGVARGFRLSWHLFAKGCGGRLSGNAGVLLSPNYPGNYPHKAHCEWQLHVHPGSSLRLVIEDMEIEDLFDCSYDYLRISSGGDGFTDGVSTMLCTMPDVDQRVLHIDSNEATIVFHSDVNGAARGFRLSYSADCQHTLNTTQGIIESINYGEAFYEGVVNCSWQLRPLRGNQIRLEVSHFDHHANRRPTDADGGVYLIVGGVLLPILGPGMHNYSGDTVTIVHNTSSINFRLEYRVDGCLQELRGNSGSFRSLNNPLMYPNDMECYWLIHAPLGHIIEVTVLDMDIEQSVNCSKDALVISNNFRDTNAHERHCGQSPKLIVTSAGHKLHVRFIADGAHNGRGFAATYRTYPSRCGGKLKTKNGVIQSPDYPKPYPPNSECEWVLEVTPHHTIIFDMQDLDVESGHDCHWDNVAAYDLTASDGLSDSDSLEDSEGHQIFKACSRQFNKTSSSTTNRALVRFITDDSVQYRGFQLHYHESCGQTLSIDETDFQYISLLHQLARNETCLYVLKASDPSKHIIFTPTHVQLHPEASAMYASEGDCMTHGIRIYEGDTATGTPRQQFCRTHPPALISRGLALTISVPMALVAEFEGNYMTMDTACGSNYDALSGRFTSPYYPDSYPVNIECEWLLEASAGNSLALTIESLDMEQSDGCNNDYLELREESPRGALIGVYCGNQLPAAVSSKGSIWIKFKSNDDIVGEGFMASYNYEHHNELNGTQGSIESPHYPGKFESGQLYSWRITVDTDYVVLVNVDHLRDIDQQHLRFYDGYTDIGALLPVSPYKPLVSNTNVLYITATRGPFRMNWERLSKEALASNRSAALHTRQCGQQLITVNRSIISFNSPGYPHGYGINLECSWTLVPDNPASHATLELTTVDLEQFGDTCYADYLKVSSSSDMQQWTELAKICAQPNDTYDYPVYHGKPYLRLEFITDSSVNKTGFASIVRTSCGSELTAPSGLVNIRELMGSGYLSHLECVWTIRVRQGKRIRISFPESQLTSIRRGRELYDCDNYFVVRNGYAADSPFLGHGKYCENNITDVLETTSNRAHIKLIVLSGHQLRATFQYEELGHACSGHIGLAEGSLNASQRLIASPNYPNLPNPYSECVWRISVPPQHRIAVEFVGNFEMTPRSGNSADPAENVCDQEYVQLNDGSTELMPMLGRYCGNRKPDTVYSSGSELRIKFYTSVLVPHSGFQALVRLADCGGSYYSAEGTISSPDVAHLQMHLLAGKLRECVYTIEVEQGSTIELMFTSIQLPREVRGNCTTGTHLVLEEMEPFGDNSREKISDVLRVCGRESRRFLVETSKIVLRLRMPSGQLASDESFQLHYKAVGTRCGETIVANLGILQTPNYPAGVRTPTHCIWRLQVAKGRRVKVQVLDFDNGSGSNETHSIFRGRIVFANDHKMQSVIGRYGHDPPAETISTDNTMGIDVFLLPFSRHRGVKLRFTAFGQSECLGRIAQPTASGTILYTRNNSTLVHCNIELRPPPESTLLLEVRRYNSTVELLRYPNVCRVLTPLDLVRPDQGEPLLRSLLCAKGGDTVINRTVRLPFPVDMTITGNSRNDFQLLELAYSMHNCGGVVSLEPGDNLTLVQPNNLTGEQTKDCAWAVGPDPAVDEPLSPQDVQLEVSVSVDLDGDCQLHYLLLYSGPDQNSPQLGRYCNQATGVNLVVERGLFVEYHRGVLGLAQANHSSTFNVTVKYGSGCGGRLTHPYRLIDFNEHYKHNVECIWDIESEPGFHIGLTFVGRFYIEDTNGCAKDYLLVQQLVETGPDAGNWTNLQKLCGRDPPTSINSTSSSMRLIFRSDGDVAGDGFVARFERNCGGILTATAEPQLLTSPGYPKGYGVHLHCKYTFRPLDKNAPGVLVRFLVFDLERSPMNACMFDNVTMSTRDNGDRTEESLLCGVKNGLTYRGQRSISLLLRSDSSFSGRGFKVEYSTSLCGGIVNATQVVESPRQHQDNKMPHNSDCYWNLTAPVGYKFTIKFNLLDFEAGSQNCNYDGVEVFSSPVPDEKQRMARFCGQLSSEMATLHIAGNRGLIHSYSDERDSSRGFRALVRVLPNCDELIFLGEHNSSYTLNKYVGSYANNLDCSIVFKARPGTQLSVEFNSFHVQATNSCSADFLEIRDGAGPFADEMGKFCGHDLPPKMSASRHVLFLRFVTDAQTTDTGFELVVTTRPLQCGNPLIKLNGHQPLEIHSPVNDQGNYDNNVFCLWKIESDISVHLKFVSLDLEAPNATGGCIADYLKIYKSEDAQVVENGYGNEVIFSGHNDGHYLNYATEHVYCGSGLPDDYYVNSRQAYVKFRTNEAITKHGFRILVVPDANCQYSYGGLQGRVKIAESRDCDAFIVAPVNYTLSLYFSEVVFGSSDCTEEYVEIFDKSSNKSLKRICAYLDPGKSLFTTTNQVRLQFKTGSFFSVFDVTYIATPVENGPGCGGRLYNTEGIFANAFYPQNVRNNSNCVWSVQVPSNTRVLLNFEFFNLGSKATCHTDYLTIEEVDADGLLMEMRRFCGEDNPRVYLSKRSSLNVRFRKSVNYDGIGWVIKFSGVYDNYKIPQFMLQ